MDKTNYDLFMDIKDIKSSARFLMLCTELLELKADMTALSSLVALKYDSHAIEAAKETVKKEAWYTEAKQELFLKGVALKKAQDDPQARLQAMFKAKMEGKL